MIKAYMNWSGGKDSALALHRMLQEAQYEIDCLLTSINSDRDRISMHDVRRELLEAQAASIGIPLLTIELPEMPATQLYEQAMQRKVSALKDRGCTHAIFGDIFLENLKQAQLLEEHNGKYRVLDVLRLSHLTNSVSY